ncbi:peptide transporter [Thermococcus sp. GR7]|uniref:M55 family metallopeptidase n=1 Tax=unclassified Thermococcus TaxID=2627626 RepID=UPI0014306AED|nr:MULTISPECIES: M55 family metallopeptidase [unclassified Thermococcus]NJE47787.1 peptide transporter [Thermococcus sp. GR7]NJE79149.1 peptide transporter [Thermococcus sp. GR4]NJF23452.1 peptide transporter [Thermococcus sp. GR5]
MRAFISVDLEGLPYIVSREHLFVKGALYNEARRIATEIVKVTAEALHRNGFDEVVVADSHGPMVNVIPEEMPEYVELVRGFPRPLSMVAFAKGSDAALFLGYHAKAGTSYATFDHTYSGASIDRLEINGVEVSEFLLNAYLLGSWNVPVILVGGDRRLIEEDVKRFTPWVEGVAFKESPSRYAAKSPSMVRLRGELQEGIARAVERLKNGEAKPLKTEEPVNVRVRFLRSDMADTAELLPFIKRLDGKTVEFEAKTVEEAYKVFELLTLAAAGVNAIVTR